VNLAGKVVEFEHHTSRQGNPYTEFSLADDSKRLIFFSFDHLDLEKGSCLQVEGTYHVKREVGSIAFYNHVVVEKKGKGISAAPCPSETPWKYINLIILLLIVLTAVVGILVKKREKEGRRQKEERFRQMGKEFEEHIIRLFSDDKWEILDRCSDTALRIGRKIIGDVSYDLIMKHRRTARQFIIQCKYRTRFSFREGQVGIEWAKPYQRKNYQNFQQERGDPYLVVIGVGGRPGQPEYLFLAPLDRLRYEFIWKKNLLTMQRDPTAPFVLDDQGMLK
jgi:hypothetical protein